MDELKQFILNAYKIQLKNKYVFASMIDANPIAEQLPKEDMKKLNKYLKAESSKLGLTIHLHGGCLCLISSDTFGENSTPECFIRMLSNPQSKNNMKNIEKTLDDFNVVCTATKGFARQLLN